LYIDFAKFYENGGTTGEAEADLASARKVLEKATKVNFKNVEDLAEIWCEWAEMEVRHECVTLLIDAQNVPSQALRNYDDAIRVMQRATAVPKNTKVNYHDHVRFIALNIMRDLRGFCSHSRYRRGFSSRSNFGRSTSILKSPSEP